MTITVVIPSTLTNPHVTKAVHAAAAAASDVGDSAEVLLVVNGAHSQTHIPRIDSPRLRVITLNRANAGAARNAGIAAAANNAIVFTDDDCVVPESWCAGFDQALNRDGYTVAAGPVRTRPVGPVTAFIDHQRIFDAPPLDADTVRYLITANCGFRRDLTPPDVRFDHVTFNNAAEDADFGYRLRDAGITLRWLANAAPVEHVLADSASEITDRFRRYGRANARLYLKDNRWRESVPGGLNWYRDIAHGSYHEYRRFEEFTSNDIREVFTFYELMLTSSFLIGYLQQLGEHLDDRLIDVDEVRLDAAWRDADEAIVRQTDGLATTDWGGIRARFHRFRELQHPPTSRVATTVASILRTAAPPRHAVSPPTETELNAWRAQFTRETDRVTKRLERAWHDLCASNTSIDVEELESTIRDAGASFSDGCHDIEKLVYRNNTANDQGDRP